ncbi:MAG TPA: hypothetical protein VFE42_31625 [Chloroflexota bacterium]|nr:hypothetical protein [Chloroflexota bacterium]
MVRWLVDGPFSAECQSLLDRCGRLDARLLAPTCLYSEVANALYRLCLAPVTPPPPVIQEAMALLGSMPELEIILVDRVARTSEGELTLTPQWEQRSDGTIRDYRPEIYIRGMALSYVSRRCSTWPMPRSPNRLGRRCGPLTSGSTTAPARRA